MGDLYERFTYRGKTLDRLTIASMHAAEKHLGFANSVIQGSYNRGVGASAGTHDLGGAIDLVWFATPRKVRAFRKYGCQAYWPRPALPGVWGAHHHGIVLGHDKASAGAKAQMADYRRGRNGLANDGRDPYWRPKVIRDFSYGRANVVSWRRLNKIAERGGRPLAPEGRKQVAVVERALEGFNMDLGRSHKRGRLDQPLLAALNRFRKLRHVGETVVDDHFGPKICWELCIPTLEES